MAMLTPRQRQVASYLLLGWSNKMIALGLGVAEQTIKNHLTSMFRECDVRGREHLAFYLLTGKR